MNIIQKRIAWATLAMLGLLTLVVPWQMVARDCSIPTGYGFIFEPRYYKDRVDTNASVDLARWLVPMAVTVIAGLAAIRLTAASR